MNDQDWYVEYSRRRRAKQHLEDMRDLTIWMPLSIVAGIALYIFARYMGWE